MRRKRSVIEILSCTKIKLLTTRRMQSLEMQKETFIKIHTFIKGEDAPLLQGVLNVPIPSAAAAAKFAQEDGHAGIKITWQRRR